MEEITKEIKNLDELEEQAEIIEVEDEEQEEVEEEEKDTKEDKKEDKDKQEDKKDPENKPIDKKKILIIGGIVLALIIIIVIVLILTKGKKDNVKEEKSNDTPFASAIKSSLKSGKFDKEIKEGLTEIGIDTKSVCLLSLDIDSDEEQELIAYAEDSKTKGLLHFEIYDDIALEDQYLLDAKDSIGYTYSSEKNANYWYTENAKTYTIISSAKKIIKEEDFLSNYFPLTKTYKEKPVLSECITYDLDKKLSVKKLEKSAITNKKFIKDNKIEESKVKEEFAKYAKEQEEKKAKEKADAEAKAKQEEQQKKLSGQLLLGNYTYRYGTYNIYVDDKLDGTMILYSDLTCVYKGISCTYTIGDVRNGQNELVPGLALNNLSQDIYYMSSVDEGVLIDTSGANIAKYVG